MNLIKCPMCEKDVSPNAKKCPHCGEPLKKKKDFNLKKNLKWIILGIVVVVIISTTIVIKTKYKTWFDTWKLRNYLVKEEYTCDATSFSDLHRFVNVICTLKKDDIEKEIVIYYKKTDKLDVTMEYKNLNKKNEQDQETWAYLKINSIGYYKLPKTFNEFQEEFHSIPTSEVRYKSGETSKGKTTYASQTCYFFPNGSTIKKDSEISSDFTKLDDILGDEYAYAKEKNYDKFNAACKNYNNKMNSLKEEFEEIMKKAGLELGD